MSARQMVSADPTSCLPVHRAIAPEPAAVVESTSSDGGSPKSYVLITLPFVIIILILTSALLTAGGEWRQLPYPTVIQGSTSGTFTEIPPPPQNLRPTTEDWPIRVFNFLTCPMWSGKTYLMIPSALHRYTILLYTASTAAHVFSMVGIWLVTESLVNAGQPISSWYQDIIHVFHNNLAGQAFLLPYDIEPVLSDVIFAFHDFVIVFFTWLMPVALVQHQLARHSLTPESAAAAASGVPHRKNVSQSGKRLPWHPSRRRLLLLLLCTIPLVMCLLALAVAAIVFATISNPPFSLINLFYIGELFSYVLASAALWIQARYHGDAHKLSEDEVAPLTEEPRKSPLTQGVPYRRSMHEMQSMQPEVMGYDGDEFDDPESEIGVAYYNENDPNETRGSIALPRLRVTSGYTSKKRRAAPLGTTWADLPNTIQVEVHRLVAIWSFLLFTTFLFRTVAMGYRPAFVLLPSAIPVEQTPNVVSSVTLRVLVNIFILMLPAAYVAVQRTVLFFGRRWLFGGRGSDSGGIEVLRMDPSRGLWAPAIDNGVSTAWSTEDGNNASFQRRLQSRGYMAGAAVRSSSRPLSQHSSAAPRLSQMEYAQAMPNQVQPVTSPQYVLRSSGSNGSGTGIARPGQMRNTTPQAYLVSPM